VDPFVINNNNRTNHYSHRAAAGHVLFANGFGKYWQYRRTIWSGRVFWQFCLPRLKLNVRISSDGVL